MKKLKSVLCLLALVLVGGVCLTACGGGGETTSTITLEEAKSVMVESMGTETGELQISMGNLKLESNTVITCDTSETYNSTSTSTTYCVMDNEGNFGFFYIVSEQSGTTSEIVMNGAKAYTTYDNGSNVSVSDVMGWSPELFSKLFSAEGISKYYGENVTKKTTNKGYSYTLELDYIQYLEDTIGVTTGITEDDCTAVVNFDTNNKITSVQINMAYTNADVDGKGNSITVSSSSTITGFEEDITPQWYTNYISTQEE